MISTERAFRLIDESVEVTSRRIMIATADSSGRVISADVVSPVDLPPFDQSAMDGYAINEHQHEQYSLKGEVQAGASTDIVLEPGEAIRIFTGSKVPASATSVVMQEHVDNDGTVITLKKPVVHASNIRPAGEQVKAGDVAIPEGTFLNPGVIGLAASMGIRTMEVYELPRVAIIVTGNELSEPGDELMPGKIYESNSVMLSTALEKYGVSVSTYRVEDDLESTRALIDSVENRFDMLLFSGGISVGDHDYVKPALDSLNYKEVFYKVSQKPGKPLYFGNKEQQYVFALPGNPASALTCFYLYVSPAIRRISGLMNCFPKPGSARINSDFINRTGKTVYLKAKKEGSEVYILDGQPSSMVRSFVTGNALVMIPAETEVVKEGDEVKVYDIFS